MDFYNNNEHRWCIDFRLHLLINSWKPQAQYRLPWVQIYLWTSYDMLPITQDFHIKRHRIVLIKKRNSVWSKTQPEIGFRSTDHQVDFPSQAWFYTCVPSYTMNKHKCEFFLVFRNWHLPNTTYWNAMRRCNIALCKWIDKNTLLQKVKAKISLFFVVPHHR